MRSILGMAPVLALGAMLGGCAIGAAMQTGRAVPLRGDSGAFKEIAGQTLVRLAPGTSAHAFARRHGLRFAQAIGLGIYLFEGDARMVSVAADPAVRWAEPNPLPARSAPRAAVGPDDPLLPAQWGVAMIGADKVWPIQRGRPEVVVAVIDSGVDGSHPEFEGQLAAGYDFIAKPPAPGGHTDKYGHGTHIAGVIAARSDNALGIAGIAPGCKVMPVKIFNDWGHSTEGAAAAAVIWAVDHGAKVINASWGSPLPGQAAMDAFQYAVDKDVVLVAAVG
ncbi:MAG: S8 family serine peptidase, partial [Candidatus Sericytochromatia bacterium]|nr:S8 family serine peptidase [Candidatus Tanganyikabacteria bacterium]